MTTRRHDDAVRCHECRAVLGTIRPSATAKMLIDAMPAVRAFIQPASDTVSLLCPHCGAFGRTFKLDRLRGVIVSLDRPLEVAC